MFRRRKLLRERAKPAAAPSWWSGAAVLFVSAVLLASTAHAQSRTAAVGLHRAWPTQPLRRRRLRSLAGPRGDPRHLERRRAPGRRHRPRACARRRPTTAASWRLDTNRDGVVDQAILHGGIGDKPLVGDIDRDGKDELAVYRIIPGAGGLYIFLNLVSGQTSQIAFGGDPRDVPLLGDMDGDGVQDLVLYRNGSLVRVARPHRRGEPRLSASAARAMAATCHWSSTTTVTARTTSPSSATGCGTCRPRRCT
ncbi:MAG: VCBS repeat-containing protein [Comamonadaceae bacterium]|nr:VCBS repeat-containing protein [Comamonadaceae bacterium]